SGERKVFAPQAMHSSGFRWHMAYPVQVEDTLFFDRMSLLQKELPMTRFSFIATAIILLTGCLGFSSVARAAETKYPKTLEQYEMIRTALVGDDLAAAKNGATNL